jgi:DNA-binding response OmpR family regulator
MHRFEPVDPTGSNRRDAIMENNAHVLIIDDEPNLRLVFRTTLESAGYQVAEAADGVTGLSQLRRFAADLVLLDLLMPGMSGMDVLERIRDARNPVPVVIVTAHGSIPDAVAAIKLGAIDFLSKPIKPEALRRVVGDVLRRRGEPGSAAPVSQAQRARSSATAATLAPAAVDLVWAKQALNRREFSRAHDLLREALELDPASAEAHHLMGVLRESLGQDRAAYEAYRAALEIEPHYLPALDSMRRYCVRFGLDFSNWSINPGAE